MYGNGLSTDTFISQKKVVIIPAPKPGFTVRFDNSSRVVKSGSGDTLTGCAPLTVQVTDVSVGVVKGWLYVVKKIPLAQCH